MFARYFTKVVFPEQLEPVIITKSYFEILINISSLKQNLSYLAKIWGNLNVLRIWINSFTLKPFDNSFIIKNEFSFDFL